MFHFYTQIITGSVRPHIIETSDIKKVNEEFFAKSIESVLSKEFIELCKKKHGVSSITIDEERKEIFFNIDSENHIEEIIDIRFPPAPDSKASSYQTLIELEHERIKIQINNFIENSSQIDEIDFYAKKNIQKLKNLSKQLSEYIDRLEGEHRNLFISDSNHFILYTLKHYLIDAIQFIQEATSSYTGIRIETSDKLLATLFKETPARLPLAIISLLPNEKAFKTFKNSFIKNNKEHLLKNGSNKQNLSIGNALYDFYKKKNKKLNREEQISNYNHIIHFWDELSITGKLDLIEYGKKIIDPEVEQILLPLIKKEIELLQVTEKLNKPMNIDSKSTPVIKSEPQQSEVLFAPNAVLTKEELIAYTGISESTIYKFTSAGTIPFYKKAKRLFFNLSEINKWLQEEKGYNIDDLNKDAIKSVNIKRN